MTAKLALPPGQVDWHGIYNERARIDGEALSLFNEMLSTQKGRYHRLDKIVAHCREVKDLLLRLKNGTPDTAEDVLARRYYAKAVLGRIHRSIAVEVWMRLRRGDPVRLEEALGAYDLFVLSGDEGDLEDISLELDRIAQSVKDEYRRGRGGLGSEYTDFDNLTVRQKAKWIVIALRAKGLLGISNTDYYALRNNFIGIALLDSEHGSLPLQSVAIYCAVAERLGIDARPNNFPRHVFAVVQAPPGQTLDGGRRDPQEQEGVPSSTTVMYLDPWCSIDEVQEDDLRRTLFLGGLPPSQHALHLSPANVSEMVLRTGRNIMQPRPDTEPAAQYALHWALFILGSNDAHELGLPGLSRFTSLDFVIAEAAHDRPEDIGLLEAAVPPLLLEANAIGNWLQELNGLLASRRADDLDGKKPRAREGAGADAVRYRVGHHFRHARYNYEGLVVGWDTRCMQDLEWIALMKVERLPRGAEQPFYHVVYVCQKCYISPHPHLPSAPSFPPHVPCFTSSSRAASPCMP